MHAGVGGLIQLGPELMQRVTAVMQRGGGGVSAHSLWGPGELEFEAYMRMLDSKVSTSWSELLSKLIVLLFRSVQCVEVDRSAPGPLLASVQVHPRSVALLSRKTKYCAAHNAQLHDTHK